MVGLGGFTCIAAMSGVVHIKGERWREWVVAKHSQLRELEEI